MHWCFLITANVLVALLAFSVHSFYFADHRLLAQKSGFPAVIDIFMKDFAIFLSFFILTSKPKEKNAS